MKRFCTIFLFFMPLTVVFGQSENVNKGQAFVGDPVEFTCMQPITEESIPLRAILPKGWKLNPDFGTVVYQPADALDYFDPPMIEFQARCEGECKAEAIPGNIEGYIQRLKEGWKTLATGDPKLDKLGTHVEILKEEKSEGQWLFEVKLTYPEGVSNAMYPPRYWIYRFLHHGQNPFFILIKGMVPLMLADEFFSDVEAACLSTIQL